MPKSVVVKCTFLVRRPALHVVPIPGEVPKIGPKWPILGSPGGGSPEGSLGAPGGVWRGLGDPRGPPGVPGGPLGCRLAGLSLWCDLQGEV